MLENTGILLRNYTKLYDIYKYICYSDMLDTKYIDHSINYDIPTLYSCIIPNYYIRKNKIYKKITCNYNKYISKSLIQIHNQSLLSSFDYITLLQFLHSNQFKDCKNEINQLVNKSDYDQGILLKQMKVYNYYYNKNMTKKYILKTLKNISKEV